LVTPGGASAVAGPTVSTRLASSRTPTSASGPDSFASSVTSHGRWSRASSPATTTPPRAGDSMAGTAPIRDTAQASSAMSTLSVLWMATWSAGRTPTVHNRAARSSTSLARSR
jgi:hypothetical protein